MDTENEPWGLKPAKTAQEQLERWDKGWGIWSIEMGGLGPGYEQAIQVCAIEIVRDQISHPPPEGSLRDWADQTIARIDSDLGGLTGAQVGAAKFLAYQWLKFGPAECLKQISEDRHIQVSNGWPTIKNKKNV